MRLHLNPWIFIPAFVVISLAIDQLLLRTFRARRRRLGLATDDPQADDRRDWRRADLLERLIMLAVVVVVFAVLWFLRR